MQVDPYDESLGIVEIKIGQVRYIGKFSLKMENPLISQPI